jgi:hypothetical protein
LGGDKGSGGKQEGGQKRETGVGEEVGSEEIEDGETGEVEKEADPEGIAKGVFGQAVEIFAQRGGFILEVEGIFAVDQTVANEFIEFAVGDAASALRVVPLRVVVPVFIVFGFVAEEEDVLRGVENEGEDEEDGGGEDGVNRFHGLMIAGYYISYCGAID